MGKRSLPEPVVIFDGEEWWLHDMRVVFPRLGSYASVALARQAAERIWPHCVFRWDTDVNGDALAVASLGPGAVMPHEKALATFRDWLAHDRGNWLGGFMNDDVAHPDFQRRIVRHFAHATWHRAVLASVVAEDDPEIGSGRRYVLMLKTQDPEEAVDWLFREKDESDDDLYDGSEDECQDS